jgi:cell division septum initiation protein DivIVA
MKRLAEVVPHGAVPPAADARDEPGEEPAGEPLLPVATGELWGDLQELLYRRPFFGIRVRGYDRSEVDTYVTWAEAEVAAARRQAELLLTRYGACAAELEISRRLLDQTPRSREPASVSERVGEILRLAADEATAMTEEAGEEADRVLAEARTEADAWLGKARQITELAARDRADAAQRLAEARQAAEVLLREATVERDRLAAETAERLTREEERARQDRETAEAASAAHLAAMQQEVADLRRQRDEARESLHRLTARIGEALEGVAVQGAARSAPDPRYWRADPVRSS